MAKILYIDMDGVIADFETGVRSLEPGMEWNKKEVDRVCEANPKVFKTLPIIPGALYGVYELRDSGLYDIYFLSTPMVNVPQSYMDKRVWLESNFGDWSHKRLILTHRKDLCIGDVLIDDRITNGVEDFKGIHIHFGTEKFPDWESVIKLLLYE